MSRDPWKGRIRRKRGGIGTDKNTAEQQKQRWDRDGQSPWLGLGYQPGKTCGCWENGYKNQGRADRSPRDGEVWSDPEDTSRVAYYPEVIAIINVTTLISIIGDCCELGDILEDLRLAP